MQVPRQEVPLSPEADCWNHGQCGGTGVGAQQGHGASETASNERQAGVPLGIVLKLARLSFGKETCFRDCSLARSELGSGFFVYTNLGGQLGSWVSDKFSSTLVPTGATQQQAQLCATWNSLLPTNRFEFSWIFVCAFRSLFQPSPLRLKLLFKVLCSLCCQTHVPACRMRHTPQHSLPRRDHLPREPLLQAAKPKIHFHICFSSSGQGEGRGTDGTSEVLVSQTTKGPSPQLGGCCCGELLGQGLQHPPGSVQSSTELSISWNRRKRHQISSLSWLSAHSEAATTQASAASN